MSATAPAPDCTATNACIAAFFSALGDGQVWVVGGVVTVVAEDGSVSAAGVAPVAVAPKVISLLLSHGQPGMAIRVGAKYGLPVKYS